MYLLVIFSPLVSFLLTAFLGNYFSRLASSFIVVFGTILSFFCSLYIFYEVILSSSSVLIPLWVFINIDIYNINLGFFFDSLTSFMLCIITCISLFVQIFSISYMSHDPYLTRFMSYLSLFTFFMIILVTADNYFQLFVGWEGVGLCSYLLICFWYTRVLANKAALKAMIMNRIADVFFILALIIIFLEFKTTDYLIVFNLIIFYLEYKFSSFIFLNFNIYIIDIISILILLGAAGKSAQIFFHTWLPDAMEGPTPVSSLLHAATMVTAGVFLILRSSPIIEYSQVTLGLIVILGAITSIFSAISAVFQYDVKKIIAYSTCSQLGYMFFSCGLSNYYVSMFHLFNHAFFKALLFLSAGSLIHALLDEQDIRKMGSLLRQLPFTYISFSIGSLAIIGFPFLTGFYSKDLLLEFTYSRYVIDANFIFFVGITVALLTAVYSVKIMRYVFWVEYINCFKGIVLYFKKTNIETTILMFFSMFSLVICSIFIGFIFSDLTLGWGSVYWYNSIFILPEHYNCLNIFSESFIVSNLPLIFTLLGVRFCRNFEYFYRWKITYWEGDIFVAHFANEVTQNFIRKYCPFFFNAFFFNLVYNKIFLQFYEFSYIPSKYIEKGFVELLGPYGLYLYVKFLSLKIKQITQSNLNMSIFIIFISIYFFLFFTIVYYLEILHCIVYLVEIYISILFFLSIKFKNKKIENFNYV